MPIILDYSWLLCLPPPPALLGHVPGLTFEAVEVENSRGVRPLRAESCPGCLGFLAADVTGSPVSAGVGRGLVVFRILQGASRCPAGESQVRAGPCSYAEINTLGLPPPGVPYLGCMLEVPGNISTNTAARTPPTVNRSIPSSGGPRCHPCTGVFSQNFPTWFQCTVKERNHWAGDATSANEPSTQGLCHWPHRPLHHRQFQTPDCRLGRLLPLQPSFPVRAPRRTVVPKGLVPSELGQVGWLSRD